MDIQAKVSDYETPLVTVDLDAVEHNIKKVQGYFDQHGISFRPHIKTHKIAEFTRRQLEAGAGGICCQKLSEAEVMVDEAGAIDVFIPFNLIGPRKIQRLADLAKRPGVTITVAADSQEAARSAQEAAKLAGRP